MEAVGFCRQQPLAASAGVDGKLVVWDTHTFTARGTCTHEEVSAGGKGHVHDVHICK